MSVLICKMCGGNLEIREGMTTVRCPYCGTNQTLPKLDNEQRLRLYDRANHFRRNNDYDKAMAVYEQILNEDQTDSEAYWSIILCRYGIEYVEDPATHKRIPTVNRTQYTSVLADEDYKAALRYADVVQAKIYEQEAKDIDAIQKGIFLVSQKEAPYDVFICYKEMDENGNRTKESVLADELYYELIRNGFRVFFARITLRDKLGAAYEPYIFAALQSARVMIVMGTTPENFQAVWVRNEWSRYLSLIKHGEKKMLIPAYRDMDAYDLPKEFSHLQALDMSRLGFVQDLIYSIHKILGDGTRDSNRRDDVQEMGYSTAATAMNDPAFTEQKEYKPRQKSYGWKIGVGLGCVLVLALMILDLKNTYENLKAVYTKNVEDTVDTEDASGTLNMERQDKDVPQLESADENAAFSGVMEQFVSKVYQCPAKDVSENQLAKMQQLVIRREREVWRFGYSFELPSNNAIKGFEEDSGDDLVWMTFPFEDNLGFRSLCRFSNLKKLDVDSSLTAESIRGLPLKSISAYFNNPAEAADILDDPGTVRELGFNVSVENLDGIAAFANLETLYVKCYEFDNIGSLAQVKHLKNLVLISEEQLTDFTVLGELQDLEKLYLDAEGLKSVKFISNLKKLDTLKIEWGELTALYGLEECKQLRCLSITGCSELKEMSALSELTNLQELSFEMPYGCREPALDNLTELRKLTLNNFEDCSFIENMTNLTELTLIYCDLPEGVDWSKLTSLKKLSCSSIGMAKVRIADVEALQTLESLNLHGRVCYGDISGVFRMPNLRELDIGEMYCEIDFDAVVENSTLEILYMDDVNLLKNAKFDYYGGLEVGEWDAVELNDHTDFLKKFPKLRELYLGDDGLTDLTFAQGMSSLEILDISENYITELDSLAELPSLQKVICTGCPVEDENVLKDSVMIITDLEEE